MEENVNTDQVQIVSHFHEGSDTQNDIRQDLKETKDYSQTEKIFSLRKHVTFLNGLSPEDQLWKRIGVQIKPPLLFQHWMKYVAIILFSFTLGSLSVYFSGIRNHATTMASISSPRGQITSLTLFDGSTVWLNSESTIQYSSDFNNGHREVYVEGEAYFEVTPNEEKPFIVHLENSAVKVHGTSFNVKAYPGCDHIEAVLMEGEIEFTANKHSVVLEPHERVVFSLRKGTIVKDQIDIEKTLAWKKGKYYYSNEKLSTIIGQLQRWYDIEFVFNEKELSLYTFTGVINHEKSIEYNIQLIELTNKINVEFKNEKIVITGK